MGRIIVTISGGKNSAMCAKYALDKYSEENVILYFNDTKWEHPDLYRFLTDLEKYFDHKIIRDNDGRNPEQLFYDNHALANNRMPFCSRILKAERLQKFYQDGDTIIFGISGNEIKRARRIKGMYQNIAIKTRKMCKIVFPLITEKITEKQINDFLSFTKEPLLYRLGFTHNNCSGGCVRAGKKQWRLLYEKLPEIYLDRERVEREVGEYFKRNIHFLKDETLEHLRKQIEKDQLGKQQNRVEGGYK